MVALSPIDVAVWTCPECGHGSPEPRDRQAHLDAHAQLRRFFDQWDGAAAAEVERRRVRPVLLAVGTFVVALLLVTFSVLLLAPGGGSGLATSPNARVPGADLPRSSTPAPAAVPPPAAPSATATSPAPADQPGTSPSTAPVTSASTTDAGGSAVASTSPPSASASSQTSPTVPAAPVATIPPGPGASAPAPVAVNGCLLGVCLHLGG